MTGGNHRIFDGQTPINQQQQQQDLINRYGDPLRPVKYRDTPNGEPEATVGHLRIP